MYKNSINILSSIVFISFDDKNGCFDLVISYLLARRYALLSPILYRQCRISSADKFECLYFLLSCSIDLSFRFISDWICILVLPVGTISIVANRIISFFKTSKPLCSFRKLYTVLMGMTQLNPSISSTSGIAESCKNISNPQKRQFGALIK